VTFKPWPFAIIAVGDDNRQVLFVCKLRRKSGAKAARAR
jgi:hypothetical protein